MKKQQIISLGVMCVALSAWGVDALVIRKSTPAEPVETAVAVLPAKPAAATVTVAAAKPAESLASRLVAYGKPVDAVEVDPFGVSAAAPVAATTDSLAATFRQSHKLDAVLVSQRGGKAMISGKLIAVGQTIDGFKLVAVTREAVTLQSGGTLIELAAPGQNDAWVQ